MTGSQITSGGTLTAKADSKANLGQNKAYAVEGSGYGGVAVQGAKLNDTVNRTATGWAIFPDRCQCVPYEQWQPDSGS